MRNTTIVTKDKDGLSRVTATVNASSILLGDRVELLLKHLGVTPDNYSQAKKAMGLLPKCNCAKRKRMLNEINQHAKEHGWVSALAHAKKIRSKK